MADKIRTDLVVKETKDYGQFKKLLGNRDVSSSRVKSIKESILRIGYQPIPILVNEKMEVIDGQGRLKALEALDIPVLYMVKKGLTIDDCISMNIKMKNWTEIDYIKCYADRGNEDYKRLYSVICEYSTLPRACVYEVVLGHAFGSATHPNLLNGKVKCKEPTYEMHEALRWLTAIQPFIGGNAGSVLKVLAKLNTLGLIERDRTLEQFEKYSTTRKIKSRDGNNVLVEINELYNYNRRNVVYFTDKYKESVRRIGNGN